MTNDSYIKKIIWFGVLFLFSAQLVFALEFPIGMQKVLEHQEKVALSVTFLIALIGGVLTFTSPCGFVVLPTFFSYVFKERKRALFMTAVFSAGMTVAFIIFGIVAGLIGNFFNDFKSLFAVISGFLLAVFGVMMVFNKGFSVFDFRVRHLPNSCWGVFGLGFLFAVGWTPCVGPILGGIVILIASIGSVIKGALLFGAYSLGVALPLLAVAYFSDKYDISKYFVSRHISFRLCNKVIHTHLYGIFGGSLLVIIGGIMFFGRGTGFFMNELPKYLPWRMEFFSRANSFLVDSVFFTGIWAEIVGIAIAGCIVFFIFNVARKYGFDNR